MKTEQDKIREQHTNAHNWERYETIPFAVVCYSSVIGWHVFDKPLPQHARKRFEDADYRLKYLLNYGQIIAEQSTP